MNKVVGTIMLVILATVLLLAGCSTGFTPSGSGVSVGRAAPDFQLQDLDGNEVSLAGLRGKPVLINFWATWCGSCRSERPHLEQIYQDWSSKGLELFTINVGESSAQIRDFMQSNNLSMPVLLDTNLVVAEKYNVTGIPTTFFIDKDGIIQWRMVGPFQEKEQIEQLLSKIIP